MCDILKLFKDALWFIQAQLQWPTGLSLSPLDGSLHFIDDRLVLKLTADMKVKVVTGTPLHCHPRKDDKKQHNIRQDGHKNQVTVHLKDSLLIL